MRSPVVTLTAVTVRPDKALLSDAMRTEPEIVPPTPAGRSASPRTGPRGAQAVSAATRITITLLAIRIRSTLPPPHHGHNAWRGPRLPPPQGHNAHDCSIVNRKNLCSALCPRAASRVLFPALGSSG